MNSNMTQYLALKEKFNEYSIKFKWWHGTEFGTLIGVFAGLVEKSATVWAVCTIAFIFESAIAFTYLKKTDKILKEMSKL